MEEAAVMMVGLDARARAAGPCHPADAAARRRRALRLVADYAMPNVSDKVVRIILSYTDYVRRNVWKEA